MSSWTHAQIYLPSMFLRALVLHCDLEGANGAATEPTEGFAHHGLLLLLLLLALLIQEGAEGVPAARDQQGSDPWRPPTRCPPPATRGVTFGYWPTVATGT